MDKLLINNNASVLDELKSQLSAACANYTYDFTSQSQDQEDTLHKIQDRTSSMMKRVFGDGIDVNVTRSDQSDQVYHIMCESSTNSKFIGYTILHEVDTFHRVLELALRELVSILCDNADEYDSGFIADLVHRIFIAIRSRYCQNVICDVQESSDPLALVDFRFGNATMMYKGQVLFDLSVRVNVQ